VICDDRCDATMRTPLALGAMTFGQGADAETARQMVVHYLDAGGNFIDTARPAGPHGPAGRSGWGYDVQPAPRWSGV
jgi:hypothetical protein